MALQLGEKIKKKEHMALSQYSKTHIGNKQGTKMKRKSKVIN